MSRDPDRLAELEALPENVVGEIVAGDLHISPRPAILHAMASSRLGAVLLSRFDVGEPKPGGWFIVDEPELRLRRERPGARRGRVETRADARAPSRCLGDSRSRLSL